MSKIDYFPYPTPIPDKIWGMVDLWSRSETLVRKLTIREIIFEEFQRV